MDQWIDELVDRWINIDRWIDGSVHPAGDRYDAEKDLEKRLLVNWDPFPLCIAMAVAVDVRKVIFFPGLLLLLMVTSCLSVNLDEETKAFIRLVLENCHKEASFLCNGPVSAVP